MQAQELAALLKKHRLVTHVNLIPWNPVQGIEYERPSNQSIDRFRKALQASGISVTVRTTRGLDAAAACGQLQNEFQSKPLALEAAPSQ
jgi:23S rRNA (adenine2503-C2)-methyltransferase